MADEQRPLLRVVAAVYTNRCSSWCEFWSCAPCFRCRAFSPLTGFMDEATYDHVVEHSRLPVRGCVQKKVQNRASRLLLLHSSRWPNQRSSRDLHLQLLEYGRPQLPAVAVSCQPLSGRMPSRRRLGATCTPLKCAQFWDVQADSEHERILFGLPVVLDTADPDIAVGDKLLLQYEARCSLLVSHRFQLLT